MDKSVNVNRLTRNYFLRQTISLTERHSQDFSLDHAESLLSLFHEVVKIP